MAWVRLSATTIPPTSASAAAVTISSVRLVAYGTPPGVPPSSLNEPAIFGKLSPQPALVARNVVVQLRPAQKRVGLRPALQPLFPFLRGSHLLQHGAVERYLLVADALRQPDRSRHLIALNWQPCFHARRDIRPGLPGGDSIRVTEALSLIHISEPTRLLSISYA